MAIDPLGPLSDDLFLFLRLAAMFRNGDSLTVAAKRIELSSSTVSLLLDRIEKAFSNPPLFERRAGAGGGTILTKAGKELLEKVTDSFRELRGQPPRFVVACSHALVELICPVISELSTGTDHIQMSFSLQVETKQRFDDVINRIQRQEINLAFHYGARGIFRPRPGIKCEKLACAFDQVIVSHDENLIARLNSIVSETFESGVDRARSTSSISKFSHKLAKLLSKHRVVKLDDESQSFYETKYLPDSIDSFDPITVDTIDAVIAIIKAKVADLGIVPAIYPTLLRLRQHGQVFFSDPIDSLPVAAVYSNAAWLEDTIKGVSAKLNAKLSETTTRPAGRRIVSDPYPPLHEFTKLRFGYYIDGDRQGDDNERALPPFVWRWETIEWKKHKNQNDWLLGIIRNAEDDEFFIKAELIEAGFVVSANKTPHATNNSRSVISFVSVFAFCSIAPLRLFGTWTTRRTMPPRVCATVLSEDRLQLRDLMLIQESAQYSTFISSDAAIKFDRQPL